MELKIPGKIWKGSLSFTRSRIQKHRRQKSGSATAPRLFAEMRICSFTLFPRPLDRSFLRDVLQQDLNPQRPGKADCVVSSCGLTLTLSRCRKRDRKST